MAQVPVAGSQTRLPPQSGSARQSTQTPAGLRSWGATQGAWADGLRGLDGCAEQAPRAPANATRPMTEACRVRARVGSAAIEVNLPRPARLCDRWGEVTMFGKSHVFHSSAFLLPAVSAAACAWAALSAGRYVRTSATNGDHCDAQTPCTYIAACDAGTCLVPGALGESCADAAGYFYQCRIGLYCNGQLCARRPGPGEPCTPTPFEPAETMCMDGFCDATGHCVSYAPVGAACVPLPPTFTGLVSVCGPVPQWCDGYPDGGGICIAHCY
jgi:hypothetical protein